MSNSILDRVDRSLDGFVPRTQREYVALQIARRFHDTHRLARYVMVARDHPKRLMLEAARVAAERGHAVTLFEAAELGGRLALAARVGGRELWARWVAWAEAELRRHGVDVRVGLPASSKSREKAKAAGLTVGEVGDVTKWADVIMVLVPDTSQADLYRDQIAPNLAPGKLLLFAHGFNIRFGTITVRPDVDVAMVAPKAPGHRVREVFVEGGGTPALP